MYVQILLHRVKVCVMSLELCSLLPVLSRNEKSCMDILGLRRMSLIWIRLPYSWACPLYGRLCCRVAVLCGGWFNNFK
jgi:hypothetical protein